MIVLVATLTVAAAGCANESSRTSEESGVRGRVLAGPQCPVASEPVGGSVAGPTRDNCAEVPAAARVRAVDVRTQMVVSSIRSGRDGRFEIDLPPGDYELQAVSVDGSTEGAPTLVKVGESTMTTVTLILDTGIR